jgi:hypothetical protein
MATPAASERLSVTRFSIAALGFAALWLAVALGAQAKAPTLMKSDDNVLALECGLAASIASLVVLTAGAVIAVGVQRKPTGPPEADGDDSHNLPP